MRECNACLSLAWAYLAFPGNVLFYPCCCIAQGPVDRKMVINALNSGASTFMADFEGAFKMFLPVSEVIMTGFLPGFEKKIALQSRPCLTWF